MQQLLKNMLCLSIYLIFSYRHAKIDSYSYIYIILKGNLCIFYSFTYELISKVLSSLKFYFQFNMWFCPVDIQFSSIFMQDSYGSLKWGELAV